MEFVVSQRFRRLRFFFQVLNPLCLKSVKTVDLSLVDEPWMTWCELKCVFPLKMFAQQVTSFETFQATVALISLKLTAVFSSIVSFQRHQRSRWVFTLENFTFVQLVTSSSMDVNVGLEITLCLTLVVAIVTGKWFVARVTKNCEGKVMEKLLTSEVSC